MMYVDPRLSLSIDRLDGQAVFHFRSASSFECHEPMTRLACFSFDEICEALGAGPKERSALTDRRAQRFFSNGWQSWSFGGEVPSGKKIGGTLLVRGMAVQVAHPARKQKRGEMLSHFVGWLRSGGLRLAFISANSTEGALPPVSFAMSQRSLDLSIEAYAEGARFAEGDPVAEIVLVLADSFFSLKDKIGKIFHPYNTFQRLRFLDSSDRIVPGGYESWYNHYASIDDTLISNDLRAISSNNNLINELYLRRGRPTVFQIDDGWECAIGDWRVDESKFPRGMDVLASEIESRSMIPGIWIAPFIVERKSASFKERAEWILRDEGGVPVTAGWNPGWGYDYYCYDLSIPEVEDYLAGIFDTLIEKWGYRYLKLDFLYAGMLRGKRKYGGAAYEHYDRVLRRLCSKLANHRGQPLAYLGCGAPFEPSFRYLPLMRIGADTKESWEWPELRMLRHQGRPSAYNSLRDTLGRTVFDRTVFLNDPDVVFCRTDERMKLTEREKELVALVDMMLASQIMFSDDAQAFGGTEEAAFTKRIVGLYDRLAGRDYGAEYVRRDVFRLFSRDGQIEGLVNLSDKSWRESADRWASAAPVVLNAQRSGNHMLFEARSISLFSRQKQE